MMDTFVDGLFRPDTNVTRKDFAKLLLLNTPVRQSLALTPRFTDVGTELEPLAEALTSSGSNLRDWDFSPDGMMSANATTFNPTAATRRVEIAVALVRALGLDNGARVKSATPGFVITV